MFKSRLPSRPGRPSLIETLEARKLLAGDGLSAVYFDNAAIGGGGQKDFTGAHVARAEPNLNLNWGSGSPHASIGADTFTARFAGRVEAPATGTYTFGTSGDNGTRLWVNDKLVIDHWTDTWNYTDTGTIALQAGGKYHIVLEYFENSGGASVNLQWQKPGDAGLSTIPTANLYSDERRYPAAAGVLDVTQPFTHNGTTYQAVGDGVADDTAALQAAVNKCQNTGRAVYLPSGTYKVSNTITLGGDKFTAKFLVLQGQNRDNTVIRLADAAAGFGNPASPKPLFSYFDGPISGEGFRNGAYDLTFNVGADNPGATGLRLFQNNQGGIENVTIRAEKSAADGQRKGARGLDLTADAPGPGLVKNVLVEGFSTGIDVDRYQFSMTFEHVTLQDQLVVGIRNPNNFVTFRGLTSRNAVRVLDSDGDQNGLNTFIDSSFTGSGGAATTSAILNRSKLVLRNVSQTGYGTFIDNTNGLSDVPGTTTSITEYISTGKRNLFGDATQATVGLAVEETPETPWGDPATWVVVDGSAPDDTSAIRNALATAGSGSGIVVFKANQTYTISDTIVVSGNIRRIFGNEATIEPESNFADSGKSLFRFQQLTSAGVTVDRFWTSYTNNINHTWFEQGTTTPLTLKNFVLNRGRSYKNTMSGGKLFIEDVVLRQMRFTGGVSVFARQINPEGSEGGTLVTNDGSNFWALGFKTESNQTELESLNGATTEIFGGLVMPVGGGPGSTRPWAILKDSRASISWGEGANNPSDRYTILVRETRGTDTREYRNSDAGVIFRGLGTMTPLFTSYGSAVAPAAPAGLSAASPLSSQINLGWTDNSNNESNFRIERKTGAGGTWSEIATVPANTTSYSDTGLTAATQYYYRIRAYNGAGNSAYSAEATATTQSASPVSGTLLAYDRFDYAGGASLSGQNGGSGFGVGWSTSGGVTVGGGLTFSDYAVTGGSASLNNSSAGRPLGAAVTPGTTLWTSFLFDDDRGWQEYGSSMGVHFATAASGGSTKLGVWGKAHNTGSSNNSGVQVDGSVATGTGATLQNGGTYLLIGKFTNVGLGSASTPQVGKYWALSAANYDAIKSGGVTEAELDANNVASGSETVTSTHGLTTSDFVQLVAGNTLGRIDELKIGTDVSVVTLPPGSSPPAPAALLAKESFDYATGGVAGVNGGVGFGGAWSANAAGGSATVVNGLTFSDYAVVGNALQLTATDYAEKIASRPLSLSSTPSTVYQSFLYKSAAGAPYDRYYGSRFSSTQYGALAKMATYAKSPNGDNRTGVTIGTTRSDSTGGPTQGGGTYLYITRFTNLGTSSATGKLWVLSAANYDAIKAGGITEAELDANNTHALTTGAANVSLGTTDYLQFFAFRDPGGSGTFDEFKLGQDLQSVTT